MEQQSSHLPGKVLMEDVGSVGGGRAASGQKEVE